MDLNEGQKEAVITALQHERDRVDETFGILSSLGLGYESESWQNLVDYRTDVASALLILGKEFRS